jgi:hypothetical protein
MASHIAVIVSGRIIAICGIAPVNFALSDPAKAAWNEVSASN